MKHQPLVPILHPCIILETECRHSIHSLTRAIVEYYTYEHLDFETVSIEDVHILRQKLSTHRPTEKNHIYILTCFTIGHDAQHALLKLLEEVPRQTHLVWLMYSLSGLLPTVLSRALFYRYKTSESFSELGITAPKETHTAEEFLRASYTERLAYIDMLIKKEKTETSYSGKIRMLHFLKELEIVLQKRSFVRELAYVIFVSKYILEPGGSLKILGEYLSIMLPYIQD